MVICFVAIFGAVDLSENFEYVVHHFAVEFLFVDDFAVRFDFASVKAFDANFFGSVFFGAGLSDVFAFQEFKQHAGYLTFFDFVDEYYVEQSVVHDCVGAYGHSAADTAAVAYAYHKHCLFHRFAVDCKTQMMEFQMNERIDERGVIFGFAFEGFHVGVTHKNVDVHSRACYVKAAASAEVDIVDVTDVAFQNKVDCVLDFGGVVACADKVVARSAGDYAERPLR